MGRLYLLTTGGMIGVGRLFATKSPHPLQVPFGQGSTASDSFTGPTRISTGASTRGFQPPHP